MQVAYLVNHDLLLCVKEHNESYLNLK